MRFKHFSKVVFGLALFIGSPGAVSAQQIEFSRFQMPVREAIGHNKNLMNAELEQQKLSLEKDQVKGKRLPKISANAGYGYLHSHWNLDLAPVSTPVPGISIFEGSQNMGISSQVFLSGVTASQVVFSGLQISNGEKALDQKRLAQQFLHESNYDELAKQVVQSFDQLMLLKEADALVSGTEQRLQKEYLKIVRAIENGMAIPYDRDKVKLAILELESKKEELRSQRDLLYLKLMELTGMPLEELSLLDYPLEQIVLQEDQINRLERKELSALEASQRAYGYALKKEKGGRLPQVFAFANLSYANAFDTNLHLKDLPRIGNASVGSSSFRMAPNYAIGVGVRWTLFDGRAKNHAVKKAKLDLEINQNKIEDTQAKLSLLQQRSKIDYQLAIRKLPVHQQQMRIVQNNLHLASRQFQEGLIDITDRLAAENDALEQSLGYYQQVMTQRQAAIELLTVNGLLYQTITKY